MPGTLARGEADANAQALTWLVILASAPRSSRACMQSTRLFTAAVKRGVAPCRSMTSTLAPQVSIRYTHMSVLPRLAAMCRAVRPEVCEGKKGREGEQGDREGGESE